ncbi:MAG: FCSD flavin-binding domain-containing protein [Betaproteobacteria bacterium]|nr:FCSD flavin-binding domain-containing protein [Betaproteobacteria bacterium]
MSSMNRRDFIQFAGAASALGMMGAPAILHAAPRARVVVVGAGYGGAIAARYLRMADPAIEVTLVEQNPKYVSCPLSNEILGGEGHIEHLTFDYKGLAAIGVKIVIDTATGLDPVRKRLTTKGGRTFDFDRAILSPGIQFNWGAIEGYDEAASQIIPHAYKAGPQTLLLRKQVEAMRDGGTVIITAPEDPFRCPPGPYERAAMIAHYFKKHKPRSKILILDSKDTFSKQALFKQGWERFYPGMISWVSGSDDGDVRRVDVKNRTLHTMLTQHKADVINIIAPHRAGAIAEKAGLAGKNGWCPIEPTTFESTLHKGIHVIGDSTDTPMPKSAYSANSQAKVCVAAILAQLNGEPVGVPAYTNTCYSLITPDWGFSVAHIFRHQDGKMVQVPNSGGVSPLDASVEDRRIEAIHARSWFRNITTEMFG